MVGGKWCQQSCQEQKSLNPQGLTCLEASSVKATLDVFVLSRVQLHEFLLKARGASHILSAQVGSETSVPLHRTMVTFA